MARLGIATDYVTLLGDDALSQEMAAGWAAEGVGTDLVGRVPGRLPGLYLIETDASGERTFLYWRSAAPARDLMAGARRPARRPISPDHALIYLSGITLSLFDRGRPRATVSRLLAELRRRGSRVAFDGNYRPARLAGPGGGARRLHGDAARRPTSPCRPSTTRRHCSATARRRPPSRGCRRRAWPRSRSSSGTSPASWPRAGR